MTGHGYSRSKYDSCMYFRKLVNGSFIYLLLYVDDMLIAFSDIVEINKLKAFLKGEFDMKDLGAVKKILGMKIKRNRKSGLLHLTREIYRKDSLAFWDDRCKISEHSPCNAFQTFSRIVTAVQ